MKNDKTYVACEPDTTTMYLDTEGRIHESREDALYANFNIDLSWALNDSFELSEVSAPDFTSFVKKNPDLVDIILGRRDFT